MGQSFSWRFKGFYIVHSILYKSGFCLPLYSNPLRSPKLDFSYYPSLSFILPFIYTSEALILKFDQDINLYGRIHLTKKYFFAKRMI